MASDSSERLAGALLAAYQTYVQEFHAITRRAKGRFEAQDWTGSVHDGLARLRLYKQHIDVASARCAEEFGAGAGEPGFWEAAKAVCRDALAVRYDGDLALMFIDSVRRRALSPRTFVPYESDAVDPKPDPAIQARIARDYPVAADMPLASQVARILRDCGLAPAWRDLEDDARASARAIEEGLRAAGRAGGIDGIEMLAPLFYRNKGAYLVGRIRSGGEITPLAFALGHPPEGIVVDAVLTEESDLRRIFSYTRSNFHVELVGQYRELLDFLRSIMPHKNWAALSSSIGFMNPAKIQLARDLDAHRRRPGTRLSAAWGIPGLVMAVFTSPGFPYVFKVIRDDDKVAKAGYIGRQGVKDKYRLVQEGDRVGRLLDTITFHHLRFKRDDFDPRILRELLETAGASVAAAADDVFITHCYAQREATPLPIYLRQCDWPEVQRVLGDLGSCLKQMAAADLFPGEFDLKNFGVAEDGRVVFFDFDGLDALAHFSFDEIPLESSLGQEECFEYLLHTYRISLIDAFRQLHPELFTPGYWRGIQKLLAEGAVLDTFPYPEKRRLAKRRAGPAAAQPRAGHGLPSAVDAELERLGLKSAHRRGLLAWEAPERGIAVGGASLDGWSPAQRQAVRQAFGVDERALGRQRLGVIVVDDAPAFVYLPGLPGRVIDLSGQYAVEPAVAASWRERVRRAVFGGGAAVEFASPAPARGGEG